MRLFLQTYELRASRRLQVSVVYLLLAWVGMCGYQALKFWTRKGDEVFDIEAVFVLSTTIMLAVGIFCILVTGKQINDIAQIGFPHVLRVKQAELLEKSSHYLVEHDFFHGTFLHREKPLLYIGSMDEGGKRRTIVEELGAPTKELRCQHHADNAEHSPYDNADRTLFQAIERRIKVLGGHVTSEETQPQHESHDMVRTKSLADAALQELEESTHKDVTTWLQTRLRSTAQREHPHTARCKSWKTDRVIEWIRSDGVLGGDEQLATIEQNFREQKLEGAHLLLLTNDDLISLGIDTIPRRQRVAKAIADLKDTAVTPHAVTRQCFELLEVLIWTVHDEYRSGSRSHWGAEDRRTKLWFIVMGQNSIKGAIGALATGMSPILIHTLEKYL